MTRLKKHPVLSIIAISMLLGFICTCIYICYEGLYEFDVLVIIGTFPFIIGAFIIFPIGLTIMNLIHLLGKGNVKSNRCFDLITLILGTIYSLLVLLFYEIDFSADWTKVLYNNQVHTPIWTMAYPTVICLLVVGLIGYFVLTYIKLEKLPPLIIVLCISAMYLGVLECILWIIQIIDVDYLILCLFPINCIMIVIKTLKLKMLEWQTITNQEKRGFKNKFLNQCNQKLMNSFDWPVVAFLLMLPILGIIMCILVLFNQQPDYFIKSYLNTSDWNLSQKIAPQNIYFDEHYLCTVAAGGHQKVVKPLRLGVRHHHRVIVNRQLCVANAFEQILEERIPTIHKNIRYFYDTYGFPIAKMIHSSYIADIIYIMMKPLEWLFLIVIYCCDIKPENRIAVQYLPKIKEGYHVV